MNGFFARMLYRRLATSRPSPAPANDGAYAAVIFDLKARRDKVQAEAAAEIRKIEVALEGLEALA